MKIIDKKFKILIPVLLAFASGQLAASDLKTESQKESYSIGASTGQYLSNQLYGQLQLGVKTDVDFVVKGFIDALKQKAQLSEKEIITHLNTRAETLNKLQKEQFKKLQSDNLKNEKEFLAKNSKRKGVKVTKSGLQYEIIKSGTGAKSKPESLVSLNYKASLIDGYVFEDTYGRKGNTTLSMINIVDGLKEGLMLMNKGSKFKLYIPSKMGYGNVQMKDIPPNSTLIFEVDLEDIKKPSDMNPNKKFNMHEFEENKKATK